MKQTFVWTVLPRGLLASGELSLTVVASPRLVPDAAEAPLTAFPDLLGADAAHVWPAHRFRFGIELAGDAAPPPGRPRLHATVEPAAGVLDPALWDRLLRGAVVRAHAFKDLRARKVRSFPVGHVLQTIRDRYAATGLLSPDERPPVPSRKDPLGQLDLSHPGTRQALAKKLDGILAEHGHAPPRPAADPALDFFEALTFHGFKGRTYGAAIDPPKPDFHEAVSLLADYPALLRKLGLAFDLVVPAPTQPFTRLRVHPQLTPTVAHDAVTPWTAATYHAGSVFAATPLDAGRRRGGFLDLGRPEFSVDPVDVDGAALKLIQFAETAGRHDERAGFGAPARAGLPALRSAGLAVSMTGRSGRLHAALERAGQLDDALKAGHGDDQILHAEDLTRGLRVDVLDPALGRWCSLHRRIPRLTLKDKPLDLGTPEEEGTLTTAVTSPTDPAKGDDLFLHETLFHWTGWSLSAERPGARVDLVGHGVAPSTNPAANALGLAARHAVAPGSLPRLRFGRKYRLRARVVDLAGNSLPWTSDDAAAASAAAPYLRFEPVPAPTLSREADPRPGESMDRLVIRSFNAAPALDAVPTGETTARGVFPPKGAVQQAEHHGLLDASTGAMKGDAGTYKQLADLDPAQPPEQTPAPTSATPKPLAAFRYLPDPLARGVHLRGLPGASAPLDIPTAGTWPEVQPLRIELHEGTGSPAWDAATRTLRVALPKGRAASVRLSSLLPGPDALDVLGVWQWIADACPPAQRAHVRARALAGDLWQLTPDRTITLVHAVQQPLRGPELALFALRSAGKTHVELRGALELDAASTGEVELRARWSDRVDKAGSPTGDAWEAHVGQVGARTVADADRLELAGLRHEIGDTRYRRVTYTAVATSRYREHFLGASAPLDLTRAGAPLELDVLSSARPSAPEIAYVVPTFGWSADVLRDGQASRRRGQGLRIYLRRPWFSSGDGELLGVLVAHGPQVIYADGMSKTESAWLSGQAVPELPERLRACATMWGSDPTWVGAPTWPLPSLHHFPGKTAQALDLTLDELGGPAPAPWSLAVAGHEVGFDAERDLWYCDLELDTGAAYFPFVRLALCRFQPRSVAGVEVSRAALADFVQLAPDRLAWVGSDPEHPRQVRLSVSGPAPRGRAGAALATAVSARVEVLLDAAADHWVPYEALPVLLAQTQITATVAVWTGEVMLARPRGALRQRLVIEEHEVLPRDPAAQAPAAAAIVAPPVTPGVRLVYADVIEV